MVMPTSVRCTDKRIHRHLRRNGLGAFVREVGILDEILQRGFADDVTSVKVVRGPAGQIGKSMYWKPCGWQSRIPPRLC